MIRAIIVVGTITAMIVIALPKSYFAEVTYGRGYARGTVWGSSPIIPELKVIVLHLLYFRIPIQTVPGVVPRSAHRY